MTSVMKKPVGRPRDESLQERRRTEILDAAAMFFACNGYRTADLKMLAHELGVAKGTLYRYFPSKRELFLATVDRCMNRLHEAVELGVSGVDEPFDRVRKAIRAYFGFFDANTNVVELIILERAEFKDRPKPTYFEHRQANIGPWQELFRQMIREGRLRDVSVETITEVLSNLVYGTMFRNYFAGRDKSLEAQTEEIVDIVFNGLMTRTGDTIGVPIERADRN